ncbi:hypothetical protein ACYSUO_18485 [Streptomyces sp. UC4497]
MKWPLVTRRRFVRDLKAATADRERLRGERDQFAKDRDAFKAAAESSAEHYVQADEARAAAVRRADQLQARLDDALGLNSTAVTDGARWQQRRPDKKTEVKP